MVIDKDPGLLRPVQEVFPRIPIQLCVKYLFQGPKEGVEPFLVIAPKILYAKSVEHLRYLFREYASMSSFFIQNGLETELLNFESKTNLIWAHFRYPQLPRTNNISEGTINEFKYKIADCHGSTHYQTAWDLIKMVIMNYRFPKFSCSRTKGYNGKFPFELASVNTSNTN